MFSFLAEHNRRKIQRNAGLYMTLAAILVLELLSLGALSGATQDQAAPVPQAQAPTVSNPKSGASAPQPQNSTQPASTHANATRSTKARAKTKKVDTSACPTALPAGKSANTKSHSTSASTTSQANPCLPPKKIVKDGGTDEPTVQLKEDASAKKASDQISSTEQLQLATEDNLKKISGRQLTADQNETVNQIKQFMDQSKAAVADGDLERGRNLAMKARLLSDELASQ
jgi:hypothetical protein